VEVFFAFAMFLLLWSSSESLLHPF
jgi:hypothetical protein